MTFQSRPLTLHDASQQQELLSDAHSTRSDVRSVLLRHDPPSAVPANPQIQTKTLTLTTGRRQPKVENAHELAGMRSVHGCASN